MQTQALIVLLLASACVRTARLVAPAADATPRQVPLPHAQATRTRARHAMIAGCAASSLAGHQLSACVSMHLIAAHAAAASEGLRTQATLHALARSPLAEHRGLCPEPGRGSSRGPPFQEGRMHQRGRTQSSYQRPSICAATGCTRGISPSSGVGPKRVGKLVWRRLPAAAGNARCAGVGARRAWCADVPRR